MEGEERGCVRCVGVQDATSVLGVLLAGYSRHESSLGKHFARWSINESAEAFGASKSALAYKLNGP